MAVPSAAQPLLPVDDSLRMVATDLDGTIVRRDGTISDRTVAVLRKLDAAGVDVVFVTGRPPRWMGPVVRDTGLARISICSNGAQIYDAAQRRVIEEYTLDARTTSGIATDISAAFPDAHFAVETNGDFLYERDFSPAWDPPEGSVVDSSAELLGHPVVKLLARCTATDPDELLARTRALVGTRASVTRSIGLGLVEISRFGIDKGSALASLARDRGIDASEVVAFGDQSNDAPMLAWAGWSFAVANAHTHALEAAGAVTGSVDEDGVARVLEELC